MSLAELTLSVTLALVGIHTPLYFKCTSEADSLYLEIIQRGQESNPGVEGKGIEEKKKRRKRYRVQAIFAALGATLAFAGLFGVILFFSGLILNPWIVGAPIISSIFLLISQFFVGFAFP